MIDRVVGGTPVVRLRRVVPPQAAEIWVKLEGMNPAGSIKDRTALALILDGEGRVRYRGAPDADYEEGDAGFLVEALAAVLAGEDPPVDERPCDYGCYFNDPASCLEFRPEPETAAAPPQNTTR